MQTTQNRVVWIGIVAFLGTLTVAAQGDEGMWLFNNPPRNVLKDKYGFEPSDAWIAHLQRSSVRLNVGGSGSFVSSDGLVMTNHHVGADSIEKLSTKEHDYLKDGFYARTREDELKCVDLEINVLESIEDVTARIDAAVTPGSDAAAAVQSRRAAMNTIEKESFDKTGLRSDVVTLYHGGLYHLYRYKKYTDVRLVFAPEEAIAFFGGDADNFEYPRYDLDISFFRVYENGKPAKIADYLRWSAAGPAKDELVFVSGNPGRTDRLDTVAHLKFLRDRMFPYSLNKLRRLEVLLDTYSQRGIENARRGREELLMYQNSRKARLGGLAGLQDPAVMGLKEAEERALQQGVGSNFKLRQTTATAWDEIASSLRVFEQIYTRYDLLEQGSALHSRLFQIARGLVRLTEESEKPNAQRLREYRQSNLESLKQSLLSQAPIYSDLETAKLADSLSLYLEVAGADDSLAQQVLAGQSPERRAAALVAGTSLAQVDVRKKLLAGGRSAIEASHDPMIALARLVDRPSREVRKVYDEKVEEPQREAYARLAAARFALYGASAYPDATFTPRLAFGQVCDGIEAGRAAPAWTTLGGAYSHAKEHGSVDSFALPPSWLQGKDRLDLATPFNFIFNADIIGGNSGSPTVNRAGELVGIVFDGDLDSLVWDFIFTPTRGRSLAVHSNAIKEALRKIYGAGQLADELGR